MRKFQSAHISQARTAPHRESRKHLRYQRSGSLPDSLATPRYLCKVRRLRFQIAIQKQSLTRTALKTRSAEVWRQTGREREFWVSAGMSQCGGLCAMPVVIGDFSAPKPDRESWPRKDWRRERVCQLTLSVFGFFQRPTAVHQKLGRHFKTIRPTALILR